MAPPRDRSPTSDCPIDAQRLVALRRCVLGVSVIDSVDAFPGDHGVQLDEGPPLLLSWSEVDEAVGGIDADSPRARGRLRVWFQLRARLATLVDVPRRARAVGLPVGHALHPGPRWTKVAVRGGAIDLGLGILGLLDDPDDVIVVPPSLMTAAGLDPDPWWPDLVHSLEQTGRLAAERLRLDDTLPLRPFGDFDVVTLLASSAFRADVCAADPVGWRTAAVPMRQRGWFDLSRIDPAFAAAAAQATEPDERGFIRAVMVAPEEVLLIPAGGRAAQQALQDPPASIDPWRRRP